METSAYWTGSRRHGLFSCECSLFKRGCSSSSQKPSKTNFRLYGLYILAKAPVSQAEGSFTNLKSPTPLFVNGRKRRFSAVFDALSLSKKLNWYCLKAPIRVQEKHVLVLAEHIATYTPDQALAIDPFAGTVSLYCAAIKIGRSSVLVKKDTVRLCVGINSL